MASYGLPSLTASYIAEECTNTSDSIIVPCSACIDGQTFREAPCGACTVPTRLQQTDCWAAMSMRSTSGCGSLGVASPAWEA